MLGLANTVSNMSKANKTARPTARGKSVLGCTQTMHIAYMPAVTGGSNSYWFRHLAEERKHNAKLFTVKKDCEILQYLMSYISTYTKRLEK